MKIIREYEVETFEDIIRLQNKECIELNEEDVIMIISKEYKLNKSIVSKIYNYAYEEKHSSGLGEVYNEMFDLLNLVRECIEIEKEMEVT